MLIEEIKNISSTSADLKKFGVTVGAVLIVISTLLFFYLSSSYLYFLIVGISLVVLGFLCPLVLKPLQKVWMTLSLILGWISTRVILSILFYIILTPIGLASRLIRKDFLNLKFNKSQQTYWSYRNQKPYDKIDTERQF